LHAATRPNRHVPVFNQANSKQSRCNEGAVTILNLVIVIVIVIVRKRWFLNGFVVNQGKSCAICRGGSSGGNSGGSSGGSCGESSGGSCGGSGGGSSGGSCCRVVSTIAPDNRRFHIGIDVGASSCSVVTFTALDRRWFPVGIAGSSGSCGWSKDTTPPKGSQNLLQLHDGVVSVAHLHPSLDNSRHCWASKNIRKAMAAVVRRLTEQVRRRRARTDF
jgi:hypothetical protein